MKHYEGEARLDGALLVRAEYMINCIHLTTAIRFATNTHFALLAKDSVRRTAHSNAPLVMKRQVSMP